MYKRQVYDKPLPQGVAGPLFQIIRKYPGLDILAYLETEILSAFCPNQYSNLESFINHMPIILADEFPAQVPDKANKFLVTGEPDLIREAKKDVTEYFRSYLYIYCSDPFFLEIMPPRIDKAHSLLRPVSYTHLYSTFTTTQGHAGPSGISSPLEGPRSLVRRHTPLADS